ncbi:MAG: sigma-70 family RNA polymerase sigma factor [Patescibacteria group bacterium]
MDIEPLDEDFGDDPLEDPYIDEDMLADDDLDAPDPQHTAEASMRDVENYRDAGSEDLLRIYLNEVGQHPLLAKADEQELGAKMVAGREAAEQLLEQNGADPAQRRVWRRTVLGAERAETRFVQCNLRLVVSIAKRYQGTGLPLLDLIQEGNFGLIQAVRKFDHTKGFKFSTYATWWVRQAIQRGAANTARTIRLPVHAGDVLARVLKTQTRLGQELARTPTLEELAAELEISRSKVAEVLSSPSTTSSLNDPLDSEGSGEELGSLIEDTDALSPVDEAVRSSRQDELDTLLSKLDPYEREVLRFRYGLDTGVPPTLQEVMDRFGISHDRLTRIENRSLAVMRQAAKKRPGAR